MPTCGLFPQRSGASVVQLPRDDPLGRTGSVARHIWPLMPSGSATGPLLRTAPGRATPSRLGLAARSSLVRWVFRAPGATWLPRWHARRVSVVGWVFCGWMERMGWTGIHGQERGRQTGQLELLQTCINRQKRHGFGTWNGFETKALIGYKSLSPIEVDPKKGMQVLPLFFPKDIGDG